MSVASFGTSPLPSPNANGWAASPYCESGVPFVPNAWMLKMIGAAPSAVSAKPVNAVAVVATVQVDIPITEANPLAWGAWMSTFTDAPLEVSMVTFTIAPEAPLV